MADHAADDAVPARFGAGSRPDGSLAAGHSAPAQSPSDAAGNEPGSVAELLDSVLIRIDRLRDRPLASLVAMTIVGMVVATAWWLGRPSPVAPIEDRIPIAGTTRDVTVDASEPAHRAATSAGVDHESTAAGGSNLSLGSEAGGDGAPASGPVPGGPTDPEPAIGVVDGPVDDRLVVHVSGEVLNQGLVELGPGARIAEAISAAGGPTAAADVHRLNLAAAVIDGMHVRVPALGADPSEPLIETGHGPSVQGTAEAEDVAHGPPFSVARVDVNRAAATELEALPGIGPALARAIIRWRSENGGFAAVDDLLLVPGIGPAKLAALVDLVSV